MTRALGGRGVRQAGLINQGSPVNTWLALRVVLACCVLLSGCGFHLRGAAELPAMMARTYISGLADYDDLYVALARRLRANGVKVVGVQNATAELRILERNRGRRVLSVGSDGNVREFELLTSVRFQLSGPDGEPVQLEPQTVRLTRDFIFDREQVLGSAAEQDLLYDEMRRDLVRLVLQRLEAAGASQARSTPGRLGGFQRS